MEKLKAAKIMRPILKIDSALGHLASGGDAEKWIPALRKFLRSIPQPRP
jgi:hypothetical protein